MRFILSRYSPPQTALTSQFRLVSRSHSGQTLAWMSFGPVKSICNRYVVIDMLLISTCRTSAAFMKSSLCVDSILGGVSVIKLLKYSCDPSPGPTLSVRLTAGCGYVVIPLKHNNQCQCLVSVYLWLKVKTSSFYKKAGVVVFTCDLIIAKIKIFSWYFPKN